MEKNAENGKIKKNDFIEIEFTAKIKESGEIFDTNVKESAKKASFQINEEGLKPFILSVGNSMIIKGLDLALEGKKIGEKDKFEFSPEDAFGKRNPQLIKMIPLRIFTEQKIMPEKGMQLTLDGMLVRIVAVTGGRVLADFNNPLAGKTVIYEVFIKRIVTDLKEKINALQEFFFKKIFDSEISESKKEVMFKIPKENFQLEPLIKFYEKPFKEILGFEIKTELIKEKDKKEDKKEEGDKNKTL